MARGFELGDGWFAIIDALSVVLSRHAALDGREPERVRQVKEKLGTLRFYVRANAADRGAIALATDLSARLCEATGRPGRLCRQDSVLLTRAPDVMATALLVGIGVADDGRMGVPPLGFSADDMRAWRAGIIAGPVEVPAGWRDLTDGMLRQLACGPSEASADGALSPGWPDPVPVPPVRVDRIWRDADGALRVDDSGGGRHAAGVIAMAVALARRIAPDTGAAGPVGDDGAPMTARRS